MSVFGYISIVSPIFPILFFFVFKAYKGKTVLWVVFFDVLFSLFIDFFQKITHTNLIILFTFIDYLFVSVILYLLLTGPVSKFISAAVSSVFLLGIVVFSFMGNKQSSSAIAPIESIIILPFCIIYLFEQLNTPGHGDLYSIPGFWIILGFLIFISGTLFLYIVKIYDNSEALKWWLFNNISNTIYNCLLALAFLINNSNSKSKNPPKKIRLTESLENS
jgi:hypothetical protein